MDKLLYIGDHAPPELRDQAMIFRERIHKVLVHYLTDAKRAERVTIANKFRKLDRADLIPLIDA
jgi:hypothetical protein